MKQLCFRLREKLKTSTALTLFLAAFLSYSYFYQGSGQNEAARLDSIRAFVDYGNFIVDPFIYNSADLIKRNGHFYSGKAPGTFYLGLIPFVATERALALFAVDTDARYHWACYAANAFSISLLGALTLVILFWLGLRLKAPPADSAAAALIIGFGTMHFAFSTLFFSHVAASFCLILAFYQLYAIRQGERERWRPWCAGFAIGFSIVLEYPSAIGAALISLYALYAFTRDRHAPLTSLKRYALGGFIGLLPLFIYNAVAFQSAFYITYEAYAKSDSAFAAHSKGVLGIRVPLWDWDAWPQFFSNLREITVKPLRGLFFVNPVLTMIFAGFALLIKKRGRSDSTNNVYGGVYEVALAAAVFLSYLSFNACFGDSITYWGGGASFGPRYLIVTLPFLFFPLLQCLRHAWTRIATFCLSGISVFICLMATSVEPRTPYFPANPWFTYYWPRFTTGMLNLSDAGVFSSTPLIEGSVAFNYGRLLGLGPAYQLVPLYAFWLLMMWRLDRQTRQGKPRGFLLAAGLFVTIMFWLPWATLA